MKKLKKFIDEYRETGESTIGFNISLVHLVILIALIVFAFLVFSQ